MDVSRLLARTVRLLKFGAVAGALVGVGRMIARRRRLSDAAESSWPTIAETAAQNGESIDDEAGAPEPAADDGDADAGGDDGAGDDSDDDKA
ncbi:MAG: hypothetical protein F4011_12760 [Acidimicrobiaceae bacterium]|nr:hypothetical protein [Acidimicrobiaceae bacterium]MYL05035.1 hypothetical protein [Acidimicrobiaceae bacterium]